MQPPTAPPRDDLVDDQVVTLIRDAAGVRIGKGLELLNPDLTVITDLSDDFLGGSVARSGYATLHGSASLALSTELDWGNAIVRPYMTMTDGTIRARFNLGAYYTNLTSFNAKYSPPGYEVTGVDILHTLANPLGDVYALAAGANYLTEAENILAAQGVSEYLIDYSAGGAVLPQPRVWVFTGQRVTWLNIVNDLLSSIGYAGVWSDWDGRLRIEPYQSPRDRSAEWFYSAQGDQAMIAPDRTWSADMFAAPNRWTFYLQNVQEGATPTVGNGIYVYQNDAIGPTSVRARGRVIAREPIGVDAADQASLVAAAQTTIDADMSVPVKRTVKTFPNPLHWHFDRLLVDDVGMGAPVDVLSTSWTLRLSADDMDHEWTVLA